MLSLLALVVSGMTSYGQVTDAEVPGDNFSLEGALEVFKKSESPEEFERLLNSADSKVNNLDLNGWEQLADGGAHVLAMLAEDRHLRETLAGGASATTSKKAVKAKTRKAKRLSKAKTAPLGEYLGDRVYR